MVFSVLRLWLVSYFSNLCSVTSGLLCVLLSSFLGIFFGITYYLAIAVNNGIVVHLHNINNVREGCQRIWKLPNNPTSHYSLINCIFIQTPITVTVILFIFLLQLWLILRVTDRAFWVPVTIRVPVRFRVMVRAGVEFETRVMVRVRGGLLL